MIRFAFGLMAVVVVYLGWQWYGGKPTHATAGFFKEAANPADSEPAARKPSQAVEAEAAAAAVQAPIQSERPNGGLVEAVLRGDADALAQGFRRLRGTEGTAQQQLEAALVKASDAADSLPTALAVLGRGNAFLHSASGRRAARQVVGRILALPAEQAVEELSSLLERCMRGGIAKADAEPARLVDEIYGRHKILVDAVLFNPANQRKCRSHLVQQGETLDGIARKFRKQGVRIEGWTLCYINRIGRPNRLRAGVKIKIPTEPIWAKVEKESFLMAVYLGKSIVRLYWIGHGSDSKTPVTTFKVGAKLADPDWYAPDGNVYPFGHQENVLGRYFVKFAHESFTGFGAHGTAEPQSIRTQASLGCIRMRDADIEEFFRFVPQGSKVIVAATR